MVEKINPELITDLEEFGVKDAATCFNCGNCTAVCSLSTESVPFPRKVIRYLQVGAKEKLLKSPEPWLCYYCGDCTETCPREANPGEVIMGLRRYLTSLYDWTGISRLFYVSKTFEISAIMMVAALIGLAFYLFHGPMYTDRVALNVFAPNRVIEISDLIMAGVLSFFLLTNALRMFNSVMDSPSRGLNSVNPDNGKSRRGFLLKGIPLRIYIQEAKEFVVQFITQRKFASCERKEKRVQWINHLLIMTGYSTIFLLVVVGIRWFQRDDFYPLWHPVRLLGYYGTFGILYGVSYAMIARFRKSSAVYEHSHATDWVFLILLWLTALSGILVHIGRLLEWPLTTYYVYVIHLMIAVPMLVLEVPFAKWAHQLYRPLMLYLMKVKERAAASQ
jgi:quinone-modifying oxidoreductase, subunit QmoC